ncbi:MAG: SDR family NAD(P)-dependent oxidoreductase [bacterium]
MFTSFNLTEKTAWITGASYGIGRGIAMELADRGCNVAISARSEGKLEELADEIGREQAEVVPLDVTNKKQNHEAVQQVLDRFGQIDIALLNAGTSEYVDLGTPEDFDAELIERITRINYLGMIYGVEAVLPSLAESEDSLLVGMSSSASYAPLPRAAAYGASKVAIKHSFESLRFSLERFDVPVSVICPGFVETPLTDKNEFPMPCLISVEQASKYIADGIQSKKAEIHFPKRFTYFVKALTLLPGPIFRWLMGFLPKKR